MYDAIETEVRNGYTIELRYDEFAYNPLKEEDPMGTIVLFADRDYAGTDGTETCETEYFETQADAAREYLSGTRLGVIVPFELNDYGSSGVWLVMGTPGEYPDERDAGFIYCSRETVLHEYHGKIVTAKKRATCAEYLINEVKRFHAYLNGDVYGWTVTDPKGVTLEGVWGYYGESDYALEEARETVDADITFRHEQMVTAWKAEAAATGFYGEVA